MILPNFPKNCMKLRTFWAVGGGGGGGASLRSASKIGIDFTFYAEKSRKTLFLRNTELK